MADKLKIKLKQGRLETSLRAHYYILVASVTIIMSTLAGLSSEFRYKYVE